MKLSHTPGPWKISRAGHGIETQDTSTRIATLSAVSHLQDQANAQLIAEAGTVATETGLTPRQLADQRAELLEALKMIIDDTDNEALVDLIDDYNPEDNDDFGRSIVNQMKEAIQKATQP